MSKRKPCSQGIGKKRLEQYYGTISININQFNIINPLYIYIFCNLSVCVSSVNLMSTYKEKTDDQRRIFWKMFKAHQVSDRSIPGCLMACFEHSKSWDIPLFQYWPIDLDHSMDKLSLWIKFESTIAWSSSADCTGFVHIPCQKISPC